jgi:predicted DNA-binding transcriptional regulator AlpA
MSDAARKPRGSRSKPGSKLQDRLCYPPRGMRAERASSYLGMSTASFLSLVAEGAMPRPRRIRGMNIWDRLQLDAAFENFQQEGDDAPAKKRNTVDQILELDNGHDTGGNA